MIRTIGKTYPVEETKEVKAPVVEPETAEKKPATKKTNKPKEA